MKHSISFPRRAAFAATLTLIAATAHTPTAHANHAAPDTKAGTKPARQPPAPAASAQQQLKTPKPKVQPTAGANLKPASGTSAAKPKPAKPTAPPTPAQRYEARRLFRAGARAYDATKYEVAADLFDQAYAIVPNAALRFSAAQALRRQYALSRNVNQLKRALEYYRQYLREVRRGRRVADAADAVNDIESTLTRLGAKAPEQPAGAVPKAVITTGTLQLDSPIPGATARVEGQKAISQLPHWADLKPGTYKVTIEAPGYVTETRTVRVEKNRTSALNGYLREKPATLTILAGDGADVLLNGRVMGEGPRIGPIRLRAGAHRVVVGHSGYEVATKDVQLTRGGHGEVRIDLDMTGQRIAAWSVFSVTAAVTTTAIVFTGLALTRQQEARNILSAAENSDIPISEEGRDEYNDLLTERDTMTAVAIVSYVGVALGAGASLLLFQTDEPNLFEAAAQPAGGAGAPLPFLPGDTTPRDIEAKAIPLSAPRSGRHSLSPAQDVSASLIPVGGLVTLQGHF